jgi:hypothetical protein
MEPVPPERALRVIRVSGGDEEGDRKAQPLEGRPGDLREIPVGVVERDHHRSRRELGAAAAGCEQLVRPDHAAARRDERHLRVEVVGRRTHETGVQVWLALGLADAVVGEHGEPVRRPPTCPLQRPDEPGERGGL